MTHQIPWYVRRPALLVEEAAELRAAYPEFHRCELTSKLGTMSFHGELVLRSQKGTRRQHLLLSYPLDFGYTPPMVVPLEQSGDVCNPGDENVKLDVKWFTFRHQMADGALCLYQRDTSHQRISGVDALRRAERWLHEFETGTLSKELDTLGAELEEHYRRHGCIIAGPTILDGAADARGRIAAIQVGSGDRLKYVLTHAESGTEILNEKDVLEQFVGGWCGTEPDTLWSMDWDRLSELAKNEPQHFWTGEYITVDREPPILRDVEDVAKLIYAGEADPLQALQDAYSRALLADAGLILAVRSPARLRDGHDWLFLRLRLRAKAVERVEAPGMGGFTGVILDPTSTREDILRRAEIGVLTLEDFRRAPLQMRNAGRVPQDVSSLTVAMFGVGALGSVAADLFGKSGLGKVALCDPQLLRAGNALRHIGGLGDVAEKKVHIVAGAIRAHNPYCETPLADCSALTLDPNTLKSTTCIVSTIANDATELAVNERAVDVGATIYFLRAQRAGVVGRLIRVRPHIDACFECVQWHLQDGFTHLVIPAGPGETVAHECGEPVLAASAADLTAVAAVGVRRILDDISSPADTNHWLWTTVGVPDVPALAAPMAEVRGTLPIHPSCQTCPLPAITEIHLVPEARARISQLARDKFPNETGGILIGETRGDVLHVHLASDSGPKASESPSGFERDGHYCQAILEGAIADSNGAWTYVGEWHSHPKHEAFPSHTDVSSLAEISADANFNTPTPAMLIVGLESENASPVIHGSIYPSQRRGFVVPVTGEPIAAGHDPIPQSSTV